MTLGKILEDIQSLRSLISELCDLAGRLAAESADLRKEIEWKDMVIALAQRKQAEAEAERDALLEQIKARRSCLDCKHFDYCEFDDATVIDCMNCVTKNCPCYQCGNSSRWEWRGLPMRLNGTRATTNAPRS